MAETAPAQADAAAPAPMRTDPFPGLSVKQRLRALADLTTHMSAAERRQFDEAQRLHTSGMGFDESSRLSPEQRARALQWLEICALKPAAATAISQSPASVAASSRPRKLTVFELARLRRELQAAVEPAAVVERLREVVCTPCVLRSRRSAMACGRGRIACPRTGRGCSRARTIGGGRRPHRPRPAKPHNE
jgi:hypothetical protein